METAQPELQKQIVQFSHDETERKIEDLLQQRASYGGNNIEAAEECAVEALRLAETIHNKYLIAASTYALGMCYCYRSDFKTSLEHLVHAKSLFENLHDRVMQAKVLNTIGVAYAELGEKIKALETFKINLELFTELGNDHWKEKTLCQLGVIYERISDYPRAFTVLYNARDIAKKIGDPIGIGAIYYNIGNTFRGTGNKDEALKNYFESLYYCREANDKRMEANNLKMIASVYLEHEEPEKAAPYIFESIDKYSKIGYNVALAASLNTLGMYYEQIGDAESALIKFDECIELSESIGSLDTSAYAYAHKGAHYQKSKRFDKAIEYFEKSILLSQKGMNVDLQLRIYKALSEIHEEMGEIQKSYLYYKRHTEIKEKILGAEKQNLLLKLQIEQIENERDVQILRSEKLAIEIDRKTKELAITALKLIQKNELLQKISNKEISAADGKQQKKINLLYSHSSGWETFINQFQEVHSVFYKDLILHYPDLTSTELKVCILLKINLCSKDIADILFSSVRTIEHHRANIRKKMGISSSTSLSCHLSAL